MTDYSDLGGWARVVSQIIDGVHFPDPLVRIGPTPEILRRCGLGPFDLHMAPGKIKLASREHSEIPISLWRQLPGLLRKPLAVIPSARRDGSVIPVLVLNQSQAAPVLVPITCDPKKRSNTILSVYQKDAGFVWVKAEIERAAEEGLPHFVGKGFADTLPQPESASKEAISSSSGPIPVDGPTKPRREILSLPKKSSDS